MRPKQTAGCGAPIVLVHGFGASTGHYKKNIAVLSKKYKVTCLPILIKYFEV